MNSVVRLAIVDPNDTTRQSLKNLLLGIDMVWLEAECSRYEFFFDVVTQAEPDIALISLDADAEQGLALVARISQERPNVSTLVVSSSQEGSLILQSMRNGAKEFLNFPVSIDDFMAALDRIQHARGVKSGGGGARSSQIVTVAGVGGGVGCTSLAINLACILAGNADNSVALLDLDLALGDADVWLDIIPDYTIQDVAENISRLDYSLLKRSLTRHDCGAFLLPRPAELEDRASLTPDELRRVLKLLKATFTHLIIDISKNYNMVDLAALEASDQVLMVTQLDLPCLRNVVRLMQFVDQQDGLAEKIRIVVNRVGLDDSQISLNKALETIGREVFWQIPNEYATIVESRNNGVPLITQAPRSKLTKSIEQLAHAVDHAGDAAEQKGEERKSRKGLFSFLGQGN